MKTCSFSSIICVLFLFLIFVSCEKEDAIIPLTDNQEEMLTARDNAVVPFKGKYTTDVTILGPPVNGWLYMNITAEGNATHLGKSSWNGIQGSFIFSDPQMILCDSVTFIAADGSMLIGWYDGDGYGNPFGPDGVSFDGNMYITHGTDRFEGVEGLIPYYGTAAVDLQNPTKGYGVITFHDGYLQYP